MSSSFPQDADGVGHCGERSTTTVMESGSLESDREQSLQQFRPGQRMTLTRYLQDLHNADTPSSPIPPKYHTGKMPNSKSGDGKPRLLLMGQRRSGKSSISSVVFHKLPPVETLYLETTTRIKKDSMHSFMDFQVWDLPGHLDYFDPIFDHNALFSEIGALIWVIDAQDEYLDAIARLNQTILYLQVNYPAINIEVFVHKVDGLSEEYRQDVYQDVVMRVTDELSDANVENAPVQFYQTSIYDHSIFEAFSKVIQKLIPQLPTLEALLGSLCRNCRIEKAYLFDVLSKIYIATDTTPAGAGDYEVCSDYIDVVVDISEIYGWRINREQPVDEDRNPTTESSNGVGAEEEGDEGEGIEDAESLITMERGRGNYLYLRELNRYLALICIMGDDSPTDRKALIDYNVGVFQEALKQVLPLGLWAQHQQ